MAEDDTADPEETKKKRKRVPVPVQPGDTMRTIAERVLGDPTRWRELKEIGITKDDLVVGESLKIPRKLVSEQFIRRRFSRRAMNADETLQAVRRANDLEIKRLGRDGRQDKALINREIERTYNAYLLERDRQLRETQQSWNSRGVGMSGVAERDVAETQSLLDADRQEWETQKNDDFKIRQTERQDDRQDLKFEIKEEEREARVRAGERWNERKARERAVERGLV